MSQEISLNDYVMNPAHKIGRGSSGIVYLGYHRTTRLPAAIKRVDISNLTQKMSRIWNEIQIMKSLSHPNIVQLYDVFIDIDKEYLYLILEYCDGSDLSDYIQEYTLDLGEIHSYFTQIRDGMKYLYHKGIVHRDLKPHNLLLHQGIIKIADFGLSTSLQQDSGNHLMQTMCGSPLYMSPEIIEHQKYTAKSDLWSLGVILYQLIYHRHPLDKCQNLSELTHKMKYRQIDYPDLPPVDPLTMDLMQALLSKNCHNRIAWEEFFNHGWFAHPPHGSNLTDSLITSRQKTISKINHPLAQSLSPPKGGFFAWSQEENQESQTNSESLGYRGSGSSLAPKPDDNFDLSQFVMADYQKKPISPTPQTRSIHKKARPQPIPGLINPSPKQEDIYGTSAPDGDHPINYSPSRLNFNSVGGHISRSMIQYASQTFTWLKESIDY